MHLRTPLVLIAVLLLGLPAAARASGSDVIRDCADDGKLNKPYSQKELEDANRNLPSDIDEYTDCRSVIQAALHGGSGSTGSAPPGAGAVLTASGAIAGSPHDVGKLAAIQQDGAKKQRGPIAIGGREITPGNAGLHGALAGLAGSSGMPGPLLAAIAALVVLAVVTAYLAAREKFPVVRRVALRVFGR